MRKRIISGMTLGLVMIIGAGCSHKPRSGEENTERDTIDVTDVEQIYNDDVQSIDDDTTSALYDSEEIAEKMKEESVRKFVMNMYAKVLPAVERGDGDKLISRYCDENFTGWLKHVAEHDATYHNGEIGFRDCEFWTRSQDPDAHIKPTIIGVKFFTDYNDNEYADVKVSLKGDHYPSKGICLRLFHFEEGWKVTDYDGMLMDMKSYIVEDNVD
ncbi:MAG: hypothetical protein K2K97_08655 [Muribaculaceae bacterium]|nr:hypothetical protein [Muribaculaceae bacterium]